MDITIGIAFWGGMASVLSPCVFPLLPSFYAQLLAFNPKGKSFSLFFNTLAFILGFTFVFVALGAGVTFIGRILFDYLSIIRRVGGLIIVILGLTMLGILDLNLFLRSGGRYQGPKGVIGSFLFGVVIGSGWLPCVGPILASILLLSSSTATVSQGVMLLSVYSLGFAIPIITSIMLLGRLISINKVNKYLPTLHKISGAILVTIGVLVFFDYLSVISVWLGGIFLE